MCESDFLDWLGHTDANFSKVFKHNRRRTDQRGGSRSIGINNDTNW